MESEEIQIAPDLMQESDDDDYELSNTSSESLGKTYTCEVCNIVFTKCAKFATHMNSAHRDYKPFSCRFCEKRFSEQYSLKLHIRTHTGEKPYVCNICNKSFSQACNLQTHKTRHHTLNGQVMLSCSICYKKFTDKTLLLMHEKQQHSKQFICPFCQMEFLQLPEVKKHILKVHMNELSRDKKKPEPSTSKVVPQVKQEKYETTTNSVNMQRYPQLVQRSRPSVPNKALSCKSCNLVFCDVPNYKKHMMAHAKQRQSFGGSIQVSDSSGHAVNLGRLVSQIKAEPNRAKAQIDVMKKLSYLSSEITLQPVKKNTETKLNEGTSGLGLIISSVQSVSQSFFDDLETKSENKQKFVPIQNPKDEIYLEQRQKAVDANGHKSSEQRMLRNRRELTPSSSSNGLHFTRKREAHGRLLLNPVKKLQSPIQKTEKSIADILPKAVSDINEETATNIPENEGCTEDTANVESEPLNAINTKQVNDAVETDPLAMDESKIEETPTEPPKKRKNKGGRPTKAQMAERERERLESEEYVNLSMVSSTRRTSSRVSAFNESDQPKYEVKVYKANGRTYKRRIFPCGKCKCKFENSETRKMHFLTVHASSHHHETIIQAPINKELEPQFPQLQSAIEEPNEGSKTPTGSVPKLKIKIQGDQAECSEVESH